MTPSAYYALLVATALADGEIQAAERTHLDSFARRLKLSPGQAREIEAAPDRTKLSLPSKPADRERTFRHLVRIAAADGECSEAEQRLLLSVGSRLGKSREDLARALEAVGVEPPRDEEAALPSQEDDSVASIQRKYLIRQTIFVSLAFLCLGIFVATASALTAVTACLIYGAAALVFWRCPGCGMWLSVEDLFPERCSACQAPLSSRRIHKFWNQPISDGVRFLVVTSAFACLLGTLMFLSWKWGV